jgi:hypothetical protein
VTDEEGDGWITNDPGLICMIGDEANCKGRACLPLSEYAPLIERVVELEALVATLRERLARIATIAAG